MAAGRSCTDQAADALRQVLETYGVGRMLPIEQALAGAGIAPAGERGLVVFPDEAASGTGDLQLNSLSRAPLAAMLSANAPLIVI